MIPPQPCWRCLTRFNTWSALPTSKTLPSALVIRSIRAFSNTTPARAGNVRSTNNTRGRPVLRLSKKKRVKNYKQPSIGERKLLRKRIVLSNTNALEVSDLDDFTPDNATNVNRIGEVVSLRGTIVDDLRSCDAFRTSQSWGYFRRPACLVRDCTVEVAQKLKECGGEEPRTLTGLIVGPRGSGKSVLLLQAQAFALMNGWVVINFPDARDLTSATTAYAPLANTDPVQYFQKDYTSSLLQRVARSSRTALSTQPILRKHPNLPPQYSDLPSLQRLAEVGARDKDSSWTIFQALWTELNIPNREFKEGSIRRKPRPPVLMTLDGLAHIARLTNYLAPSMHYIHAQDLTLVKHFLDHLSGARPLVNGGAILAADSQSNGPASPALDLAIRQSEECAQELKHAKRGEKLSEQPLFDPADPWNRIDERSLAALRGAQTFRIGGLAKDHTRNLLEYYAKSGMLRQRVTEGLVGEAWTVSGGGIIKQLEKAMFGNAIL